MDITFIPSLESNVTFKYLEDYDYFIVSTLIPSNNHIKIDRDTYKILENINSKKSIKDIYNIIQKGDTEITEECLLKIIIDFQKFGIIQSDSVFSKINKQKYLKLSITVLSPIMINKVSKIFGFAFKRFSIYILLFFSLLICSVIISNNMVLLRIGISIKEFLFSSGLFVCLYMATNIIHEFGHTTALARFNEKSGRMGLGFYLFIPVLFVDVSNAWKLNRKSRIIINLGGLYFELLFVTILFVFFKLFGINQLFYLGYIILIQIIFQLNPFIRTDGYWIICDLLNVTNLMEKSQKELIKIRQFSSINIEWKIVLFGFVNYLFSLLTISLVAFHANSIFYLKTNLFNVINEITNGKVVIIDIIHFLASLLFYFLCLSFILKTIKIIKK